MFDIAFSELLLIALVALLVIGPERLPRVARTAGQLWGRVQRFAGAVKRDIEREAAIEDARKLEGEIRQEIDTVGNQLQKADLTLQQQILQAQYRKADAAAETKPPATPE